MAANFSSTVQHERLKKYWQLLCDAWAFVRRHFCRFLYWEFWPLSVFYFPLYFYFLWLSFRARSLFFFSAVNPRFWVGGLAGESKWQIYTMLPKEYLPPTYFLAYSVSEKKVQQLMKKKSISYPIVLKPNVGQKGRHVCKIKDDKALIAYLDTSKEDLILQTYVDYPLEVSVFYYRFPKDKQGTLSSLVIKKPLTVIGDGHKTVKQLMQKSYRTNHYVPYVEKASPLLMRKILPEGEEMVVSSIGSHAQGATCTDARRCITSEMQRFFERLSRRIPDFYYGRFDIRCRSLEDLAKGRHFSILELNGVGAIATHIYDPRTNLLQAHRDTFKYFRIFYRIAQMNNHRGIPYLSWSDGLRFVSLLISKKCRRLPHAS